MMRPIHASATARRLRGDRRGSILVMFVLMLSGLMLFVGCAVDLALAVQFRSQLQDAVDAAALAGASNISRSPVFSTQEAIATSYMNASLDALPPNNGVSFAVSPFTTDSNGTTTAYNVKVAALGQVRTLFVSLIVDSIPVSVEATATNTVMRNDNASSPSMPASRPAGDTIGLYTGGRNLEIEALGAGAIGPHLVE
jgi:Flp pilus assembly protein TadG